MNAGWFPAVALSLLASSACNPFHHETAVQVSARDAMVNSRWHANLASPASLSGVVQMNGSASMTPGLNGTSTIITLDLANAAPGGVHPWEAHYGQCGDGMDNGVFGTNQAYQALKVASDGRAKGTATVSLETPQVGSYFVEIHASALNPEMIVACGNLAPPTQ
jgi:hypothetical protein